MTRRARLLAPVLLLVLASCGSILPAPPPAPLLYRLTPIAPETASGPPVPVQLVVAVPAAPAALDTQRIALARSSQTVDYFAGVAWTDRAPVTLQTLIVESLENGRRIRVVAAPSPVMRADVVLASDLRHFEAVYSGAGPPTVDVQLDCRLIRMPDRTVIAVKSFAATARAAANDTSAIVAAFDTAFHTVMDAIAPWTAQRLETQAR